MLLINNYIFLINIILAILYFILMDINLSIIFYRCFFDNRLIYL